MIFVVAERAVILRLTSCVVGGTLSVIGLRLSTFIVYLACVVLPIQTIIGHLAWGDEVVGKVFFFASVWFIGMVSFECSEINPNSQRTRNSKRHRSHAPVAALLLHTQELIFAIGVALFVVSPQPRIRKCNFLAAWLALATAPMLYGFAQTGGSQLFAGPELKNGTVSFSEITNVSTAIAAEPSIQCKLSCASATILTVGISHAIWTRAFVVHSDFYAPEGWLLPNAHIRRGYGICVLVTIYAFFPFLLMHWYAAPVCPSEALRSVPATKLITAAAARLLITLSFSVTNGRSKKAVEQMFLQFVGYEQKILKNFGFWNVSTSRHLTLVYVNLLLFFFSLVSRLSSLVSRLSFLVSSI